MSDLSQVPQVTVVIPARDEEGTIAAVVRGAQRALAEQSHEILVIDDGSSDGTGARAAEAGARVLHHPYSKGNGAAIKRGIREARGEV